MQKKLIALAIAGLASTAAFAQSNVTIYGVMDASIDSVDTGKAATLSSVRATKISSNQSRIGFKGTEDLGDGLKAVFQIETAINADGTATTSLNSRNTFVGLQSDSWGRVILGQHDSPYKTSTRAWDVFGDSLADARNIMGQGFASFDDRPANTIRYDSPDMNGFSLAVAYAAGAETIAPASPSQKKGNEWAVSGAYNITSAWTAIAAYEKHEFGSATTGTLAAPGALAFVSGAPAPAANDSEKAWKVGVAYKEGACRASAVYEKTDFTLVGGDSSRKAWNVEGGYMVNASNEIKLSYIAADKIEHTSNTGAKQWAVGVDHIMSKRTKLYAQYVKLNNDSNAKYSLTGAGGNTTGGVTAAAADADPSAFQFGVRHTF